MAVWRGAAVEQEVEVGCPLTAVLVFGPYTSTSQLVPVPVKCKTETFISLTSLIRINETVAFRLQAHSSWDNR